MVSVFQKTLCSNSLNKSSGIGSQKIRPQKKEVMGLRKLPLVFTEQGVAMLSSVLNSETAIEVNIKIIRVFTRMREMLITHKDILLQLAT